MLQINGNKSPKEQRNIFQSEIQLNIGYYYRKKANLYKIMIHLLFITGIILFSITINIKNHKIKDTIFSFECYNGNKDIQKLDLNFERNNSGINGYK